MDTCDFFLDEGRPKNVVGTEEIHFCGCRVVLEVFLEEAEKELMC